MGTRAFDGVRVLPVKYTSVSKGQVMPTSEAQLALLDQDTLNAAYYHVLKDYRFEVRLSCKKNCGAKQSSTIYAYADPVAAIENANRLRDDRHRTRIEIVNVSDICDETWKEDRSDFPGYESPCPKCGKSVAVHILFNN